MKITTIIIKRFIKINFPCMAHNIVMFLNENEFCLKQKSCSVNNIKSMMTKKSKTTMFLLWISFIPQRETPKSLHKNLLQSCEIRDSRWKQSIFFYLTLQMENLKTISSFHSMKILKIWLQCLYFTLCGMRGADTLSFSYPSSTKKNC